MITDHIELQIFEDPQDPKVFRFSVHDTAQIAHLKLMVTDLKKRKVPYRYFSLYQEDKELTERLLFSNRPAHLMNIS